VAPLSPLDRQDHQDGAEPPRSVSEGAGLIELAEGLPPHLLTQAVTHSSWVEGRDGSYERLEFLGDSVLGLIIASTLYQRFPEKAEGPLARAKAFVVSRISCAQVAEKMEIGNLILAHGPVSQQKRRAAVVSSTVLGNVLEALIGAIYLTYGYDTTYAAVADVFEDQLRYAVTAHVDHKTTLQEVLALEGLRPSYSLVEQEGPPHARIFTSEVSVDGRVRGRGKGTTIKMSEQVAASEALTRSKERET